MACGSWTFQENNHIWGVLSPATQHFCCTWQFQKSDPIHSNTNSLLLSSWRGRSSCWDCAVLYIHCKKYFTFKISPHKTHHIPLFRILSDKDNWGYIGVVAFALLSVCVSSAGFLWTIWSSGPLFLQSSCDHGLRTSKRDVSLSLFRVRRACAGLPLQRLWHTVIKRRAAACRLPSMRLAQEEWCRIERWEEINRSLNVSASVPLMTP